MKNTITNALLATILDELMTRSFPSRMVNGKEYKAVPPLLLGRTWSTTLESRQSLQEIKGSQSGRNNQQTL